MSDLLYCITAGCIFYPDNCIILNLYYLCDVSYNSQNKLND